MKKAPKLSHQRIINFTKTPAFFESLQYRYGSFAAAGKKLKIPAKLLSDLGKTHYYKRGEQRTLTDKNLDQLSKGIRRMDKRDYVAGRQFVYARAGMSPAQLRYLKSYTRTGSKRAGVRGGDPKAYFRRAVREYYLGQTKRVLMPAINKSGKVFDPYSGSKSVSKGADIEDEDTTD